MEIEFTRVMQMMQHKDDGPSASRLTPSFAAQDLRDALSALNTVHEFSVGQIVRQKRSCRLYKDGDGEFSIVVQVFDEPFFESTEDSSSSFFRSRIDIVIGQRADDRFILFHIDSRRYEPVPLDELVLLGDEKPTT